MLYLNLLGTWSTDWGESPLIKGVLGSSNTIYGVSLSFSFIFKWASGSMLEDDIINNSK